MIQIPEKLINCLRRWSVLMMTVRLEAFILSKLLTTTKMKIMLGLESINYQNWFTSTTNSLICMKVGCIQFIYILLFIYLVNTLQDVLIHEEEYMPNFLVIIIIVFYHVFTMDFGDILIYEMIIWLKEIHR